MINKSGFFDENNEDMSIEINIRFSSVIFVEQKQHVFWRNLIYHVNLKCLKIDIYGGSKNHSANGILFVLNRSNSQNWRCCYRGQIDPGQC